MVSQRLQQVPASGTLAISNLVSQLKSEGIDVISFSLGEPDFTTPDNILDAAKASLDRGFTHYTPSTGIPELRKAVAERARSFNKLDVQAKNVLITPCKHAIFMAAMAYIDPGDEVLLPDPGWVTYEADIRLCGGIPVYVPLKFEDGFVLDPAVIESLITPKTRMIILNTPANPTGCVIPEKTIRAIAELAMEHDIIVLADETYENLVYSGKHFSIASIPGMMDRTITVSGLSKTAAMTGWRIGWAISTEQNIKDLNKLQGHTVSCCTSFAQEGAVEALTGDQAPIAKMVAEFKERRDLVIDLLSEIEGLETKVPEGAFYVFPKYSADISSVELAKRLLEEQHVAVTPGIAFGPHGEGFFRISYAASEADLREGIARIKKFMGAL
jgi:aspartate aminotransferase